MMFDERLLKLRLYLSSFIIGATLSSSTYFIPIFLMEMGASYTFIGLTGSLRGIPYSILPFFVGFLTTRYDLRTLYMLSPISLSIGLASLYFSRNYLDVIVGNILVGISMVFYWPVAESIIAEFVSEESKWKIFSGFSTSWSTAYFIGPIFGGFISQLIGVEGLFLLCTLLSITGLPIIYSMGKLKIHKINVKDKQRIDIVKSSKSIWSMYVSVFLFTFGMSCITALAPSYFYEIGWSNVEIGLIFTLFGLARTIAYMLTNKLNIFNPALMMIFSTIFMSLSIIFLARIDFTLIIISLLIAGFVNGIFFISSFILINIKIDAGYRSTSIGLMEGVLGLGFIISPGLIGFLIDILGAGNGFLITSLIVILALPFLLLLKLR
ncbi:MAG: MFS transporter [Nitrososphaerota archaeon]